MPARLPGKYKWATFVPVSHSMINETLRHVTGGVSSPVPPPVWSHGLLFPPSGFPVPERSVVVNHMPQRVNRGC